MTKELMISKDLTPAIFINKDKNGILEVYNIAAEVEAKVKAFKETVDTKKGQDAIRSFAAKIGSSKVAVEKLGKDCNADLNKQVKATTAVRQEVVKSLQEMQEAIRKPLTELENAEKARVEAHNNGINQISKSGDYHLQNWQDLSVEDMQAQLVEISAMSDGTWEEFNDAAEKNIKEAVEKITNAIKKRKAYDAEQAELTKLREEAAKRDQEERNAKIAADAVELFKAKQEEVIIPVQNVRRTVSQWDGRPDERRIVQENMQKFGGEFVQALGVALTRADSQNTMRIKSAFPEYWKEYLDFTNAA